MRLPDDHLSEFRIGKYRNHDHREDTPHFTDRKSEGVSGVSYNYLKKNMNFQKL